MGQLHESIGDGGLAGLQLHCVPWRYDVPVVAGVHAGWVRRARWEQETIELELRIAKIEACFATRVTNG